MILLVDNYDSFVDNLARYLRRLGQETVCVRNDQLGVSEILSLAPEAIVLSPGPCTPNEAGCSSELVRRAAGSVPLLGVCLGHQVIGAALGGQVVRAPVPMHGRASQIVHDGEGLFVDLPSPLTVGRYHSLVVAEDSLPPEFKVTARTLDGVVMAVAHREWPVFGVQFHPESILTDGGYTILENFLRIAGLQMAQELPDIHGERPLAPAEATLPAGPVTF